MCPCGLRAVPALLRRRALLGGFATAALGQLVETAIAEVRPAVLAARLRDILAVDVGAELRACCVPILYLAATRDRLVTPRSLAHIRRLQPRVQVVTVAGPHLLLQASPAEAAQAIEAFAESCESQTEAPQWMRPT
jgi:pimeloyl-ACP methyl ester carboxylesterase